MRDLDSLDVYDVKSLLTEEELLVQSTVARFVTDQVLPIIDECFQQQRFPRELIPELATDFHTIRHMLNLESLATYEGTESVHALVVGKALTGHSSF